MGAKYIARHGAMRFLGEYEADGEATYARGQRVVLRTERGLEVGEVLCPATAPAMQLLVEPTRGHIARFLSDADEPDLLRIHELEVQEFGTCNRFIAQRSLQMELVDVEH